MIQCYDVYKIALDRELAQQFPPSEVPSNPQPVQQPSPTRAKCLIIE